MIQIGKTTAVQSSLDRAHLHRSATELTERKLRNAAQQLEATFIAEMLKHAGFGDARDAFGGGAGEDQFSSYLRQAQADAIATSGGIGLAEHLFEALKEKNDGFV